MLLKILSFRCKRIFIHNRSIHLSNVILATPGHKESFRNSILTYFENVSRHKKEIRKFEISTQIKNNSLDNSRTNRQLELLHRELEGVSNSSNLMNEFDNKWAYIVSSLTYFDILNLLNMLSRLMQHSLTSTKIYENSMNVLLEAVEHSLLSNLEIVQLVFFISLKNEKSSSYMTFMKSHMPNFNELTLMEKCIVAQAFYRTSVKLQKSQSRELEKIIENETDSLLQDQNFLVSLCKAIRITGPSEALCLKNLSVALINLEKPLNFSSICHVFSLYAESLVYDSPAASRFINDSLEYIKQDNYKHQLRIKDLDRFLWSMSHLGIMIANNEKKIIRTYFKQRLREYKMKDNLGTFVNSLLCLHMLECWSTQMIKNCFASQVFEPIFQEKFHWKIRSRLQLLISQIEIELEMVIPEALKKQIKIEFSLSKNLQNLEKIGVSLAKHGIIRKTVVECPICTLCIPGMTITSKKMIYHLDILDSLTCLRNTNIPHGLMQLKIRLVKKMKIHNHILLNSDIFDGEPDDTKAKIEKVINTDNACVPSCNFQETLVV